MATICLSPALGIRCLGLSHIQEAITLVPVGLEVVFSLGLIFAGRDAGSLRYILAAEGPTYVLLSVFSFLGHVVPVFKDNLTPFKALDIVISVTSFVPIPLYTIFLYLFNRRESFPRLSKRFALVSKAFLFAVIPIIVVTGEIGSFIGIKYRQDPDPDNGTLYYMLGGPGLTAHEFARELLSSTSLALLTAAQALTFLLFFVRLASGLVKQRNIEDRAATEQEGVLFRGQGWLVVGMKLSMCETALGWVAPSFGLLFTRRRIRLSGRACIIIGVVKGFRASNHIELLKKIDHPKGIKFPDEDPLHQPRPGEDPTQVVPPDVKGLIRTLLRRNPAERASFADFFKSEAMTNSKFPRPIPVRPPTPVPQEPMEDGKIPEHHMRIPAEVLDPRAMIPPSKFNFRRRESEGAPPSREGSPSSPPKVIGMVPPPLGPRTTSNPTAPDVPVSRPPLKPLSTEGSIIPGETEEDGLLRREYVLVGDTQAVEFNKAVDEINAARRRPLLDHRVPLTPAFADDEKRSPDLPHNLSPVSHLSPTFPPPPNPGSVPIPAGRSATNALSRALTLASKKLFGPSVSIPRSPPHFIGYGEGIGSHSPRMRTASMGEVDPVEDELLGALEQLAQKTHVITRWGDEMYEFVKSVPQKPLPDPSKFAPREGENEKLAARRRNADVQAEYNAVTCVAIYMLIMQFSQKGIDELRKYQEHMEMRHPEGDFAISEGFDEALGWFRDHFLRCHDRAALVKTWLPAQYTGPNTWVDELVYNRALTLSRTAARKELLDQHKSPDECERLYEESLWCLYALQDDLLQKGNPFVDEDRDTIATWIKRTKLRLVRCHARMEMPTRERLRDARADKNLDDVARIPAPWDAEALEQFHRGTPPH